MAASPSIQPLPAGDFGYVQARHLLTRAGFGGSHEQVAALHQMGLRKAIDFLVDYESIDASKLPKVEADSDIIRPYNAEERTALKDAKNPEEQKTLREKFRLMNQEREADDRDQMTHIENWWMARIIATPRPLEEKLTLLWHGHFASNNRTVRDSYLMYRQNEFFRKNASGSFADLARGIVEDPAMIRFLNNDSNRKAHPNENLARELMELFTLGVGHYSEQDIKEGARALTGNAFNDNDFVFRRAVHDEASKTILGQTGNFDGTGFVNILLARADCPRFVAYKLCKHFVEDMDGNLSDHAKAYIEQVAQVVRANDYKLKPVLKTIFASQWFYDPAVIGNQVKSPVQLIAGTIRTLKTPVRDLGLLSDAAGLMGQRLFEPPSVAGWDGGRGWINTSTLFIRQNVTTYLLTNKLPFADGWGPQDIAYDTMPLLAHINDKTPAAVVDHLLGLVINTPVSKTRRDQVVAFVESRKKPMAGDLVLATLMLIAAMPEYQVC